MSTFHISKGHDLKLAGNPLKKIINVDGGEFRCVHPVEYKGMKPKLLVKEGQSVQIGDPVFFDKTKESVKVVSPVTGIVEKIVFGERRVVEKVLIKKTDNTDKQLDKNSIEDINYEKVRQFLLDTGMWSFLRQRPFSKVPDPSSKPRAIFISMINTSPFSLDLEFALSDSKNDILNGLKIIQALTDGKVYLSLKKGSSFFDGIDLGDVNVNYFSGPHPAGNVGIQIHHIAPISGKEDCVWYLSPQDLVSISKTYTDGVLCLDKIISCGGSGVSNPAYYKVKRGMLLKDIVGDVDPNQFRLISGDVLSGTIADSEDSFKSFDETISVIEEIQKRDFVGWALPGLNKYSLSNTFLSSAMDKSHMNLKTGLNGSLRAIIPFGRWERYLPMDIFPDFLIKSILALDIEEMEKLGIYECDPEDFALCAFACQSKIEVSEIVNQGLLLAEVEG